MSKYYKTEKVIVLVVDGTRYSENWGEPNQQYIPNMKNHMAEEGVIFTNFRNEGSTFTNPGHTAILTGYYQAINNSGGEIPQRPSFLNYWLKNGERHKTDAWLIASKDKLEPLSDSQDPKWAGTYIPSLDCGVSGLGSGYRKDSITIIHALDSMKKYHPSMVLINLRQPDVNGHTGDWGAYIDGIRQADDHSFQIWNFIQENDFYKGRTSLFITNDHGRHLDESGPFSGHGDDCEGCRRIQLYAYGPDFGKNRIVDEPYGQIDISATIAEIMGFDMPTSDGKVIDELFIK